MDLGAVMIELGEAVDTISGLQVATWLPNSISPPTAIVSLPDEIDFDASYSAGMSIITIPIVVVIGRVTDRTSIARLVEYANAKGGQSIKHIVDNYSYRAVDSVTVKRAVFDTIDIAEHEYIAGVFEVHIVGSGD